MGEGELQVTVAVGIILLVYGFGAALLGVYLIVIGKLLRGFSMLALMAVLVFCGLDMCVRLR